MMRSTRPAAALLVAGVMLVAGTAMSAASSPPDLEGTAWVLSSLPGRALQADAVATLRFEDGRVVGTDGCNRYTTSYSVKGSVLEIAEQAASTQMACHPEVMRQAQAFMAALVGARSYRIEAGRLHLVSADDRLLATLSEQSRSLTNTAWRATGINNGKGAVASLVAGSSVTVAFGADGTASGSAGCNRFTARYETTDSTLRLQTPAATRKMCAAPGLMEQEQQFLKALEASSTMRVEADRLELRDSQGALTLMLRREP